MLRRSTVSAFYDAKVYLHQSCDLFYFMYYDFEWLRVEAQFSLK